MSGGKFLAPEHVRRLKPYPTGKPSDELRRELGVERIVSLASNENPYGPSPKAMAALRSGLAELHRYPDGGCYHLRQALARRFGLSPEGVVVGAGSGELVDLICKAFLADGEKVVISRYGFVQYRLSAMAVNADVVDAAVGEETLADDLGAFVEAARGARVVFLANPNNPTGSMARRSELEEYFAAVGDDVLTVVDQAYQEYVDDPDYPDALEEVLAGRNVIVLRTFSKIYGLAGLRIGFGLGPADVLQQMEGVRLPFNTTSPAQAAALAALDDDEHVRRSRELNREQREALAESLRERGYGPLPSAANFLLVACPADAGAVYEGLLRRGILVRPMAGYGLQRYLRITVGTAEENASLLEGLDAIGGAG